MDVAYNQHTQRRKYRSSAHLNHISLAPLTTRLPLPDDNYDADPNSNPYSAPPHTTSYIQGKSAPTTPRLLSHSPGHLRSSSRPRGTSAPVSLPKSKSTTHLTRRSPNTSSSRRNHHHNHRDLAADPPADFSDWLLRAGALIANETRESKGQSWLLSRASSTSLTRGYDAEEAAEERRWAAERRNTAAAAVAARKRQGNGSAPASAVHSPVYSRMGSRVHSRVGSRVMTPGERRAVVVVEGDEDYFGGASAEGENGENNGGEEFPGPDFVNLDEKLEGLGQEEEEEEDTIAADEAYVRRLLKRGNSGVGGWLGNMLGLGLFAVREDEEDDEDGEMMPDGGEEGAVRENKRSSSTTSLMRLDGTTTAVDSGIPPPGADQGVWKDAAWLMSVAARVLL